VSLSPETLIRRNPDIIAAGIAEQTILLNPKDWTYVHFNETAARIWEVIDEPRTVGSVVDALTRDYAVERSTCEREAAEFVRDMSERGFVLIDAAA
jgi:Coenzyme PQQ synthesis protein D (PqqD)